MWAHRSASGTLSAILVAALVVGAVLATVAAGAGVAAGETGEAGRNGDLNATNDTTNTTTETLDGTVDGTLDGTADTTDDTLDSTDGTTGDGTTGDVTNATDDSGGLTDTLLSTTDDVVDATLDADAALEVDGDGLDASLDADASLDGDSSTRGTGDLNGSAAGSGDDRGATAAAAGGSSGSDGGRDLPLRSVGGAALGVGVTALAARRVLQSAGGSSGGGLRTLRATGRFVLLEPDSWRGRWWRFLGLLGYQRYDDSDPLAHDGRARIHRCITTREGAYLSEVARATGTPLSTVRYHLRVLEHEGLVTTRKVLGKRWYVPVGADRPELDLALDDGPAGTVLETLADGGPGSVSDLAERLDRDPSTVTHHLSRLEEAGLVERERDGPAVVNRLAPEVDAALAEEGPAAAADRPEAEVERTDTDVERTGWAASHAALR